MTDLDRLILAEQEYSQDNHWTLTGFNSWLKEHYGVRYLAHSDERDLEILDPGKYAWFILRFNRND